MSRGPAWPGQPAAPRRAWLAVAALALALGLAGCATPRGTPAPGATSGRLLVKIDGRNDQPPQSTSVAFELSGDERQGRLLLDGPLGTRVADAQWQDGRIHLVTPQGARDYASLSALAQDTLGEDLPLAALMRWLAGQPWPQAPSTPTARGFEQLGWSVDTSRLAATGLLQARRAQAPAVTLRAVLDRPAADNGTP